jgi:hypothetical protein
MRPRNPAPVFAQVSIREFEPLSAADAAALPPGFFAPPAGYRTQSLEEKLRAMELKAAARHGHGHSHGHGHRRSHGHAGDAGSDTGSDAGSEGSDGLLSVPDDGDGDGAPRDTTHGAGRAADGAM